MSDDFVSPPFAAPASKLEITPERLAYITAQLDFLGEWLTYATEPIGVQCCGRGNGPECCGNPEPDYVHPQEVINAMQARYSTLTKELFAEAQTSSASEDAENKKP